MADGSKIEWTDATWNPIRGCSRVSEGCRHCYAEMIAARFSGPGQPYEGLAKRLGGEARWTNEVRLIPEHLGDPLRWGKSRRIFVNSMSDLFHEEIPDEWIDLIFAVMALAPQHTFQVLTKRPERMRKYVTRLVDDETGNAIEEIADAAVKVTGSPCAAHVEDVTLPLPNVWLGVSAEDQTTADERIPHLLATPAAIRFVSAEPLLGPIQFHSIPASDQKPSAYYDLTYFGGPGLFDPQRRRLADARLDWIIVGGESGPHARPMHPDWARSIRDQCAAAGVAYFFKQWGGFEPVGYWGNLDDRLQLDAVIAQINPSYPCRDPANYVMRRVGKTASGRLLDGVEHNGFPELGR